MAKPSHTHTKYNATGFSQAVRARCTDKPNRVFPLLAVFPTTSPLSARAHLVVGERRRTKTWTAHSNGQSTVQSAPGHRQVWARYFFFHWNISFATSPSCKLTNSPLTLPLHLCIAVDAMETACHRGSASFDQPPSPLSPTPDEGERRRSSSTVRAGSVRARLGVWGWGCGRTVTRRTLSEMVMLCFRLLCSQPRTGHLALLGLPAEFDDIDTAAER